MASVLKTRGPVDPGEWSEITIFDLEGLVQPEDPRYLLIDTFLGPVDACHTFEEARAMVQKAGFTRYVRDIGVWGKEVAA